MGGGLTHKITDFKPDYILQWEANELNSFFFNDLSSRPDRGISQRHGTAQAKSDVIDAGGGAHVGTFNGSAEYITYKKYFAWSGPVLSSGCTLKDEKLPNRLWNDPTDPIRGGTCR